MKKIVFIHLLNDYSGSPKVLSQVVEACQGKGYETVLFTGQSGTGFLTNKTDNHYTYFYKRFNNKYLTLFSFTLSQTSLFLKLLRYRNKDVVFYVNTMLPFGAGVAGKLLEKPVYYHVHETSLKPLILKKFLRMIVQKTASKVIFVSESLKRDEGFSNKKQFVVFNALTTDFMTEIGQAKYQWKCNNQFEVLMICSLKAYKGVNEFIDIARKCIVKNDVSFTLILNATQSEIESSFLGTKLPENISVVSRQTNLIPYLQKSSLLLNLSRIDEWVETFGLTIIEAMAFGIPVIVPPVGGPTEIVADGIEGFLISSYDTEKITDKILELSDDEAKCLELSGNAKKRSEIFMPEIFEKDILKVINE